MARLQLAWKCLPHIKSCIEKLRDNTLTRPVLQIIDSIELGSEGRRVFTSFITLKLAEQYFDSTSKYWWRSEYDERELPRADFFNTMDVVEHEVGDLLKTKAPQPIPQPDTFIGLLWFTVSFKSVQDQVGLAKTNIGWINSPAVLRCQFLEALPTARDLYKCDILSKELRIWDDLF
ncbi:uncharacterized protein Z519_03516 [Cladophialophora bantiana CBS 173.52]|uniref:Uncharacterized protein n=1 Tax=Cladophialophora bantiana (strain ATCC 10958 / CBS 173.52 / CDC B-1940 / NIH 8579) TaxID=1442370 RepID=A0A0D2GDI9_CLAB1|nr:uncharacterized protein Z519_03516 [Cladophialophora bantiana CBS 173.52]KIW96447.1 hypothetical protein Z519_03516 [Cladophialophora bantiana CBS 173.52]